MMNVTDPNTWNQIIERLSDPVIAGVVGGLLLVFVLGFCAIFARTGFHWSLGLLMAVPGVNLVPFLMLAFCAWPVNRELRSLRKLQGRVSKAENSYERAA